MKPDYEYDIALSFAGEDRDYVEKVANSLRDKNIRVFYDRFEEANLWGKNLYSHLSSIYQDKTKYTVIFISKSYSQKLWTNHERENAQARAFSENKEYILPARFDDTEIPGISKTIGYVDLRDYTPEKLALLIYQKINPNNEKINESKTPDLKTDESIKNKKSSTFNKDILAKIRRHKTFISVSLLTVLSSISLILILQKFIPQKDGNSIVQISSVLVTFNTLDDNKDFDTKLFLTLSDNSGQVISTTDVADNMGFRENTTHSFTLPINAKHYKNDILKGTLEIIIDPNGNDDWNFTPIVLFKFSDGSIKEVKNFGAIHLSKNIKGKILSLDDSRIVPKMTIHQIAPMKINVNSVNKIVITGENFVKERFSVVINDSVISNLIITANSVQFFYIVPSIDKTKSEFKVTIIDENDKKIYMATLYRLE